MALTQYLYLGQGHGGYFDLPTSNTTPPLNSIGTHGCRTCVCVYIPLSPTKCFAAHISAHVNLPQTTDVAAITDWIPTPAQGASLKDFTLAKLANTLPDFANGEYKKHSLRKHAVVICPHRRVYHNGAQVAATGSYIVQAINEFFHLEGEGTDNVSGTAHGFVVDHASHKVDFIPFEGADEKGIYRYLELKSKKGSTVGLTESELKEMGELYPLCQEKEAKDCGFEGLTTKIDKQWSFRLKDGAWEVWDWKVAVA